MRNITWNDKPLSRQREAWLLLIHDDTVYPFEGRDIPGVCAVVSKVFHKDGKWSNTTYNLAIDDEVMEVSGYDDFNSGRFVDGLRKSVGYEDHIYTWGHLSDALDVTVSSAMRFLRAWRPTAAERIDSVEAGMDSIGVVIDPTILRISFGGPTNREIREGYWTKPIIFFDVDANEIARLTPDPTDHTIEWTLTGADVVLLDFRHDSGYHGGYITVVVTGPEGTNWTR